MAGNADSAEGSKAATQMIPAAEDVDGSEQMRQSFIAV
jgi:hypothetical protein